MKTGVRLVLSSVIGLGALALLLFLPAGTLNYWQAWVFIAAFTVATIVPSLYLAKTNPAALQRRMHGGPLAEGRAVQKFIITGEFLELFAMMALSAYDHRMGWSSVPAWVCLLGDVLVVGRPRRWPCWWSSRTAMRPPPCGWRRASIGLQRSLQARAAPDVRRRRDLDGGHAACTGLLLGTAAAHPRHPGAGLPHPRRGEVAHPGIGRVPRIHAAGALPIGAATSW